MAKIQLFSLVFNILIPASVLQDVFPEEEAKFNPLDRFRFENVDFSLADAVESDVIFKYYSDAYQINPRILTIGSVSGHMDKEAKTVYMIHGYTQDDTDPWFRPLKRELFIQRQFNIVYINWVKAGNKSYDVSSANINPVGKFIADFIVTLWEHI
ncbi:unnamed protein product [Acanthoscelides obtectus]|uniref:Lipase domain-containing protein n=1 Tax=Acanthoscelides obtectus TaxID=200917 RepID=A0A9P0PWN6_ACAOB|nr:unnamed protein product [Acanthoscelides obtectus]CAK1621678.1 hypothetical protein AOBTE_LOCUS1078 [Acanthoscelides obtectus]